MIEYRSRPEGDRSVRLLWRLARWERTPESSFAEIKPLFALHSRKPVEDDEETPVEAEAHDEERFRFTLLLGLVDYRREGDQRNLKLLYFIPAWRSSGSENIE